jgi:hypothetical protein
MLPLTKGVLQGRKRFSVKRSWLIGMVGLDNAWRIGKSNFRRFVLHKDVKIVNIGEK